ncbi:hypothetical protein [Novosphingobium sp. Chol11]|uniref:hypothetical protein n=1 Tax=Novosphingobium sp. Chol11 TaxID=1385763 RepID=UPI000BE38CB2|nr:hypothetical protein [Novosphingobium sp. Chol11]
MGALLCLPLAYCEGKSAGKLASANTNLEASLKVQQAAQKVERAATLADMARRAKTREQITELREIVRENGTDAVAGPGVTAVLDRLRRDAR